MAEYSRSFVDWWNLAGLDVNVGNHPASWLEMENVSGQLAKPQKMAEAKPEPAPAGQIPTAKSLTSEAWPTNIRQLKDDIAAAKPLPGNIFGGHTVIPTGDEKCRLMVISDIPEPSDVEAGHFITGSTGKLLTAMVNAMGVEIDQCFVTALATTRPAIGDIPDGYGPELQAFAMHQIHLVNPGAILLLGRVTARILSPDNPVDGDGNLHYINQNSGKKAMVSTYHPRTLLTQPRYKAQAWKNLQMLLKKDVL